MRFRLRAVVSVLLLALFVLPGAALADDWVAVKLRGAVFQLIENDWVAVKRGDVVSDQRVVRTLMNGRVTFRRGDETIELAPQTQIQIQDKAGKRYTTVTQHFGSVSIEADVRKVQHFEVRTPHLAAVVKGTRFVVTSGKTGASVKVLRGRVAVEDQHNHQSVTVAAGQSVTAEIGRSLDVSGRGKLPVVVDKSGAPLVDVVSKVVKGGSSAVGSTVQGVGKVVNQTTTTVGNTVTHVGNSVGNTVGNTVSNAGSTVGGVVGGTVGNTVSQTTGTVGNTVSSTVSGVTGIIGGLF